MIPSSSLLPRSYVDSIIRHRHQPFFVAESPTLRQFLPSTIYPSDRQHVACKLRMPPFFTLLPVLSLIILPSLVLATNHIDIALQRRQNNVPLSTGGTPSSTQITSNSPAVSSGAASTSAAVTSTAPSIAPGITSESTQFLTTESPDSVISSQSAAQTNIQSQTISSPSSDTSTSRSSSDSQSSLDIISTRSDNSIVVASKSVLSLTQQVTSTIVSVSGSSTFSHLLTTSALVPVSTSTSISTAAPGLAHSDSSSNGSGLSPSTKRTIIGVVVGIGGAIIIGGVAVVAWRIWGRKRKLGDDDNDLMNSHPGSSGHEKTSSVSGNTPFKSTLDQYHSPHSPPGPVNTASNF